MPAKQDGDSRPELRAIAVKHLIHVRDRLSALHSQAADRIIHEIAAELEGQQASEPNPEQPLIDLFRTTEADWGRQGDNRGWSPSQTAVNLIDSLRQSLGLHKSTDEDRKRLNALLSNYPAGVSLVKAAADEIESLRELLDHGDGQRLSEELYANHTPRHSIEDCTILKWATNALKRMRGKLADNTVGLKVDPAIDNVADRFAYAEVMVGARPLCEVLARQHYSADGVEMILKPMLLDYQRAKDRATHAEAQLEKIDQAGLPKLLQVLKATRQPPVGRGDKPLEWAAYEIERLRTHIHNLEAHGGIPEAVQENAALRENLVAMEAGNADPELLDAVWQVYYAAVEPDSLITRSTKERFNKAANKQLTPWIKAKEDLERELARARRETASLERYVLALQNDRSKLRDEVAESNKQDAMHPLEKEVRRLIDGGAMHVNTGVVFSTVQWQTIFDHLQSEIKEFRNEVERFNAGCDKKHGTSELGDILGIVMHMIVKWGATTDEVVTAELAKLKERCAMPGTPIDRAIAEAFAANVLDRAVYAGRDLGRDSSAAQQAQPVRTREHPAQWLGVTVKFGNLLLAGERIGKIKAVAPNGSVSVAVEWLPSDRIKTEHVAVVHDCQLFDSAPDRSQINPHLPGSRWNYCYPVCTNKPT